MRRPGPSLALLAALSACAPTVVPRPAAPPSPPSAPAAPPVAQSPDWQDWPVAPGTWSYLRDGRSTLARFVAPTGEVQAWVRCDTQAHTVALGRRAPAATPGGMMTLRTSFGILQWPLAAAHGAAGPEASRTASDPGLDQILFSRGRFTMEQPGLTPLVLPTWAEPARVVEDCRG